MREICLPVFMFVLSLISLVIPGQDHEPDRYVVTIVQEGWHTGIVLKTDEVPSSHFKEIENFSSYKYLDVSWGDEKYYQHPGTNIWLAVKAILAPTPAVIRLYPFHREPGQVFPNSTIIEITMDQKKFRSLCRFISNSFIRDKSGEIITSKIYNADDFFLAKRKYWLFRTCNTWVALALKGSGFDISSCCLVTANQLFRRLNKLDGIEYIQKQE